MYRVHRNEARHAQAARGVLLRARGYTQARVRAVMGGNFERVASQVWAR